MRAGDFALTPTTVNGITFMPVILTVHIVTDTLIVRTTHIRLSGYHAERLLREDSNVKDELVYLINASLGNYDWDEIQLYGSDGGRLKAFTNPRRLPSDYKHPPLNRRHLVYLQPTM